MNQHHDRLIALRKEVAQLGLGGMILATGDEHITEFPAAYSRRLGWLSGFVGSTGSIAVTADRAAVFVDGRYTALARAQVDGDDWSCEDIRETNVGTWLAEYAAGARVGYDPRLYTPSVMNAIRAGASDKVKLVPLHANPVDLIWADQPVRPDSPAFVQPIERSGKSSPEKRRAVSEWLSSIGADACVLVALDSIAWMFNIRGNDIPIVPLAYSFAICHRDGTADLFIDPDKVDDNVRQHLGNSVRQHSYDSFYAALEAMDGKIVSLDPNLTTVAIYTALEKGGAKVLEGRDPAVLPKAIKNSVEIEGMKQAHIRDGAALTSFLHWFSIEAPKGQLTELSAAEKLNQFRRETALYHSLSFDPISAADANAAMPHYQPTPDTDAPIRPDSIYLLDSGGQYLDGTTDVARTVAVGVPSAEVKDRFTRVLKGYIALETLTFPTGTLGSRLDAIARVPLWAGGVECAHGIGHGVGSFLNVHEGPAYFLPSARPGEAPIEAGMILSNEPGYYKPGEYGIRTENLMVTVERSIEGGDRKMLGFEPISMAPIDRSMIDVTMLTGVEIDWLDSYHARVCDLIGPLVSADVRHWLERETAPIRPII